MLRPKTLLEKKAYYNAHRKTKMGTSKERDQILFFCLQYEIYVLILPRTIEFQRESCYG